NDKYPCNNFGYWTRGRVFGILAQVRTCLVKTVDGERKLASETRYANLSKLDEYCAAVEEKKIIRISSRER
ncbi:MAG: hypothetical protein L6V83_00005, partial [Christensenella sp.]